MHLRFRPALALLALGIPACPARRPTSPPAPAPAPSPALAPLAPPATPLARITPDTQPVAPAAVALVPSVCTATPAQRFHLRPHDEAASAGAELLAGTELEVLGVGNTRRARQQLLHVRVRSTGAAGYTFASAAELGPGCPATWPAPLGERAAVANAPGPSRDAVLLAALRGADIVGERFTEVPEGEQIEHREQLDIDGDGTVDEFLRASTGGSNFPSVSVVVLHPAAGWAAYVLAVEADTDHPNLSDFGGVSEPLRLGSAVYFLADQGELASNDNGANVVDRASYSMLRCRVGGPCLTVFAGETLLGSDEHWTFTAEGADGLRVNNGLGRSQSLRWDPARFELVRR